MAPAEELVDKLKGTVDKLEARVAELEARLQGKEPGGSSGGDGMRMILIGPPGAGMCCESTKRKLRPGRERTALLTL